MLSPASKAFASVGILLPVVASAQSTTLIGRVVNQAQVPVVGALVSVSRLRASAQTNDAGAYRLVLSGERPGQTDSVHVTRIGFAPRTVTFTARAGTMTLDVTLAEQAIALSQVVVTGTVGNQERRAQAAVVTSVDAASAVQAAPITNVNQLLSGRAEGINVTQSTGSVGSTSVVRIRGVSSISLSNDPLVFIDGVRIDNTNYFVAGGAVSSLNDIDPNSIESVEVVKGPAAATLYGADASAGVIQIITKKGVTGQNRFSQNVSGEYGQARPNWTPASNFATCGAKDTVSASPAVLCHGQTVGTIVSDNPIVREHLLRNGPEEQLQWQGRGGGSNFGYFLSYSYLDQLGTLPANDILRHSARSNFTVMPRQDLTIDAGMGVIEDVNDQVNVGDNVYGVLTALIGNPLTVGTPTNGWFAPNRTGSAIASIQNRVTTTRFEPSVTAKYQPLSWFTHRVTIGGDVSRLFYHQFYRKNDPGWYQGNANLGQIQEDRHAYDTWTLDYLGDITHDFGAARRWSGDFSFGAQVIDKFTDFVTANAYGLATNASNSVTSATTASAIGYPTTQRFVGYLGQLQLAYANKLYLQYGARVDRNSAFVNATQTFFLPKYGVSYVISEEPFFQRTFPWLDPLRLRAAYGTTGRAPQPGAALQTYSNAPFVFNTGAQGSGVVPYNPGNPLLRAERGIEFESGLEAGLFHERVGVDLTYFDKTTKDLLIQKPIPPSLGFTQNPFVNIGAVVNRGIELGLHGQIITATNVGLDSRLSLSTLHNELTSLGGVAPFFTGVTGITNSYREHLPLGAWFSQRVHSVDTTRGVAVVSDTTEYGGSPIPTYEGSFTSDLTLYRNFRFNWLFEFKGGNVKLNTSQYFREKAFTQEERFQKRASLPTAERIRLFGPYVNSKGVAVPTAGIADDYLQDASFVRLRELTFSIIAPQSAASRLGASSATITMGGRNLKLWTRYRGGYDPESITYVPTSGIFFAADFLTMPEPQQFFVRLNLGY